jgi:hypothetical protein
MRFAPIGWGLRNDFQEKTDFGNKPASPSVYGMRQSLIGGARFAPDASAVTG